MSSFQTLLVGGVAAWLMTISTGEDWLKKNYSFVVAVVVVVFTGSTRKVHYERLVQHENCKELHDSVLLSHCVGAAEMNRIIEILWTRNN
ncbi:hypothetical protein P3T76_013986 [Phytophthora citrophthora]|uniref:Uncharacterized protein n=1 Tax=Phytophthora citrophthora TaxID=4793 RepID=A0AAD9LBS0_9STRA|nr:hypothetical protein P3T76_013986 [Phytophthora citrophthora]